ncbi:Product biotin synthase [Mycena indigotica]|uniref:Product biotin synthase n=1 Tax=Mycena indigotica TaxID=2126181 RepID=A0A8H6W890_9AGAR|nr:Product biotin synthase [Mycena indigotica]KAF7306646.1 Product biotin synthase [Mycena indigotica]
MSSLASTVAHAVAFLTRPLLNAYSAPTTAKLQLVLEANLTALYSQTWDITNPRSGSSRRCLTLSPDCLPPRAVYAACIAAGVQWFDWVNLLGTRQFDLVVDPGLVAIRQSGRTISIWTEELPQKACHNTKTAAQLLIENDAASDDLIFSMIADEICAPTWMTPTIAEFPDKPRSQSRCSSRSSSSSSGFSFASSESTSVSSVSTQSRDDFGQPKQSRRERARQARVYIDTSKKEVTEYDGGRTSVLGGGVMLGAKKATPAPPTHGWRMRI